jgi:hypothetical protein
MRTTTKLLMIVLLVSLSLPMFVSTASAYYGWRRAAYYHGGFPGYSMPVAYVGAPYVMAPYGYYRGFYGREIWMRRASQIRDGGAR